MSSDQRMRQLGEGERKEGAARYQEVLWRDLGRFLAVNLLTLAGLFPLMAGVPAAILTLGMPILLPVCVVGGAIAGPAIACMHDAILRSLRDDTGSWWEHYRRAFRQNWRQSIVPGILFGLLTGVYLFLLALFWQGAEKPGFWTAALLLAALVLAAMIFSMYWPLLVLFDQPARQRLHNCLLFGIRFFWKVLGSVLANLLYWALMVLFLPWSVVLLPVTGVWFILYTADFLLYDTLNGVFGIEERIAEAVQNGENGRDEEK